MDSNEKDIIIRTMYLNGATDGAIAYAVNMTIGGIRQRVRGMGLPLRQPQKSPLFHQLSNAPALAEAANITLRTAASRLKVAREMDMKQREVSQKNLRAIGASVPKLRTLRRRLGALGIDLDAHRDTVKLLRPGLVCELAYQDLCFLVAGEPGIVALARKINAGWVKK